MAIESSNSKAVYEGNGATTVFPFDFKVWEPSQLQVTISDPEGKASVASGWTASLTDTGGSVTYQKDGAPLPKGWRLAIVRNMPFTQLVDLLSGTRFDPQVIEDALDRATAERQQLAEQLGRTITIQPTEEKTPDEVLTDILDTASKANEYAEQALTTYEKVIESAEKVAQDKRSVELSKQSVDASEANVTALTAQVLEYSDELELVAENVSGIQAVNNNQDAISAIAADLQGYPIYEFDGGAITDPNQSMNGVGGVLKICADNIDAIKKVADSLEDSAALATLAEDVTEIGQTDYLTIASTGNSEPSNG